MLTKILEELTSVLFGPTLDTAEVDNRIVELSVKAEVNVTVLEMFTELVTFDILVGGALDMTSVLFGPALDTAEVDNRTVELSVKADVNVTVLEMITEVVTFDILEGGALDVMGVAVTPNTCLLTLRLAMFF